MQTLAAHLVRLLPTLPASLTIRRSLSVGPRYQILSHVVQIKNPQQFVILTWQCVFGLVQRAKCVTQVRYLGPLPCALYAGGARQPCSRTVRRAEPDEFCWGDEGGLLSACPTSMPRRFRLHQAQKSAILQLPGWESPWLI